ncbi:MAG TPA: hypothetical protein VIG48_00595 [Jatrophihabitans sp.]|jgi:hypothetical protein
MSGITSTCHPGELSVRVVQLFVGLVAFGLSLVVMVRKREVSSCLN